MVQQADALAADRIEHRLTRALQEVAAARDATDIAATEVHREMALRYTAEAQNLLSEQDMARRLKTEA